MLKLIDFTQDHVEQAAKIARENYEEERKYVPILPSVDVLPDLAEFAKNGLGVAAFEDGEMAGFLCCYDPIKNFFGKTLGTFSPMHAHGAVKKNRNRVYSYLYQSAAEKWVSNQILSHAIALYAHDSQAIRSFFWNGFGMRCVDAIRPVETLACEKMTGYEFRELTKNEMTKVLPLQNTLNSHMNGSPIFMPLSSYQEMGLSQKFIRQKSRIFAASEGTKLIAYIEIGEYGETFACEDKNMINIGGACCLPEYRGKGIYKQLLAFLLESLKEEGSTRLGVDFESFNPTARGFWLKHFTPYTNSVVRRIDERICDRK